MKVRTQKTLAKVNGCPQRDRSETEWYGGVQTFMWMCEDNIVEVPFDKEHLLERILSPDNLNQAYKGWFATRDAAVSTRCLVRNSSLGSWLTTIL